MRFASLISREAPVAGVKNFAEAPRGGSAPGESDEISLPFVLPLAGPFGAALLAAMFLLSLR